MTLNSAIEWTDASWNPTSGCTKVSAGCKHCYAERMAKRLQAMGSPNYRDGFAPRTQPHMLAHPLTWKKPRRISVNSMSDLFHPAIPLDYIKRVFAVMRQADWHQFQALTKRSARLLECDGELAWAPNMWMGVSVENEEHMQRIDDLRGTSAHLRFLSLEPLLGPLPNLNLTGIHWVIVGGESGPGARPMQKEWVLAIQAQCQRAGVPFFFKQWGGVNKKKAGRLLEGRTWEEMPRAGSRQAAQHPMKRSGQRREKG